MNMFVLQEKKPKKVRVEINNCLAQQNITKKARDNAVVVAGDTLSTIQGDSELVKEFLDLCMEANVVLACRVSPKQKAEIVRMMRVREPQKTTLAIGDGANDVNMITEAHIGVGISGLEGQQAVRASDFSIGQFRFLKNLLFQHGREAYRRNTYAICYMYYKNILLVMPIWFYGFFSQFSGTQIYNLGLLSLYNVTFTSLPVIWFTTWDREYEREILLSRPRLYRIGLENRYFSKFMFGRWIFYATAQGLLMLAIVFLTLTSLSPNYEGHLGSIELGGSFVFTCIVIVVNIKILISSFEITFVAVLIISASIVSYIVCFWLITIYSPASNDYYIFYETFLFPETYFSLFFFMSSYVLVDSGMRYAGLEIDDMITRRRDRDLLEQKRKQKQQTHTSVKSRIVTYDSKSLRRLLLPGPPDPRCCVRR